MSIDFFRNILLTIAGIILVMALALWFLLVYPDIELRWHRYLDTVETPRFIFSIGGGDPEKPSNENRADSIRLPSVKTEANLANHGSKDLDTGAWIKSKTLPGEVGNVVVVGHRFNLFSGTRPFYHLDKLQIDDYIDIHWRDNNYKYRVSETFTVTSGEVWIESEEVTGRSLTIYTCQLIDSDKRLVIKAILVDSG